MTKIRHFLSITDISKDELLTILDLSAQLKKEIYNGKRNEEVLKNKSMLMIFEKPSLRTRVSFEIGMTQLGGHALYLAPADIGMGTREEPRDVAAVVSRMGDIIMARTFKHSTVEELAAHSKVPVINALSDLEHPCQILADLLTIQEVKGTLQGLTITFLGDGNNNVTHTMALAAGMLGIHFRVGAPEGYFMDKDVVVKAKKFAAETGGSITESANPEDMIKDADVVVTDTWVSMGDEAEKAERLRIFPPYQVSEAMMKLAKPDAIFMHCLPAYRDKEVAASVLDGPQSVAYQEAENRLHAQKGLIVWLMNHE
ncbi:ornithine carbamoyltransferase [Candidatus Woesebacteria bacterium]|nr:ornithine carbamoyltransferase [Candidatus Woesebacteria bacterium]